MGALLIVLVGAGAWLATRAFVVTTELSEIRQLQQQAQSALTDGDVDALGGIADDFDTHATAAAAAAGDPVWRAAEVVPLLGPNLAAARVVTEQLQRVSTDVAVPVVALTRDLSQRGLLVDGALDVDLISSVEKPLASAVTVLEEARSTVIALDSGGLAEQVVDGVRDVETLLDGLASAVGGMADLTRVLPRMLGSDEPRTILVMLQNNAELRSGGGITGSFAEIVADGCRLTLVRQADSTEFPHTRDAILPIPESTTDLYGDIVGRFVQNTTTTPDFDLSAQLASAWWDRLTGNRPDIVLSIDPLVLRALLEVTGPILLGGDRELVRDAFVLQVLINPYMYRTPAEQTVFFQDLTQRFFSGVTASSAPPSAWIAALQRPIEQGRISVWSSDDAEAEVLADTAFAGPLARHRAAEGDAFMVYLNDVTGAKMDSSLAVGMGTVVGTCRADERPEVAVTVTLANEAPADAGTAWPYSMTGSGRWGTTAGHIATEVSVAAPEGWFFGGSTVDGKRKGSVDVTDGGFPTSAVEVDLAPGESAEVEIRFVAPDTGAPAPSLLHTPLLSAVDELDPSDLACD